MTIDQYANSYEMIIIKALFVIYYLCFVITSIDCLKESQQLGWMYKKQGCEGGTFDKNMFKV